MMDPRRFLRTSLAGAFAAPLTAEAQAGGEDRQNRCAHPAAASHATPEIRGESVAFPPTEA
jgi:hypothetical protein